MPKKYLTTSEFAAAKGVTARTVQRWIAEDNVVPALRTAGGHARFSEDQICQDLFEESRG